MNIEIAREPVRLAADSSGGRRDLVAPRRNAFWTDLRVGLQRYPLWLNLGWKDIRSRYRRTVIGPFWTVLSTAILVGALGFVNATLWHTAIASYLPFFCAGYVSWLLFVTVLNESGTALTAAESIVKAIQIPYSVFIFRMLTRNLIVFCHNLLVFAVVAMIFDVKPDGATLLVPVGMALAVLNYFWISLLLAVICARFRDVVQLVLNLSTVLFFITPIFWQPSQLNSVPAARFVLADANFAYHLVDVIRAPLLGKVPAGLTYAYLGAAIVLGFMLTALVMRRFYVRVAYWL